MTFSQSFFRAVAAVALIAALLIISGRLLGFTYGRPSSLDETAALQGNALYRLSQWLHFAPIFFMLTVMCGVAARKLGDCPGLAITGFIFLLVDFFATLLFNSFRLVVVEQGWFAAFAEADQATRQNIIGSLASSMRRHRLSIS
jgi:hypothetical protein